MKPVNPVLEKIGTPPGRLFHFVAGLIAAAILCAAVVDGVIEVQFILVIALFSFIISLVWLFRLIVHSALRAQKRKQNTNFNQRIAWRSWLFLPLVMTITIALVGHKVPMRCAFFLSRPKMNALAQQVLRSKTAPVANRRGVYKRVGFYTAQRIEKIPGGMRFVASESGILMSGIYAGFAYFPDGAEPDSLPPKFFDYYSEPDITRMDSNWFWWKQSGSDF